MNIITNHYEAEHWKKNHLVAGVDEAGRGCLAGPVVAASVIFRMDFNDNNGINDSKKLTPEKRLELEDYIIKHALAYSVSFVCNETIDRINILVATMNAMLDAVNNLLVKPDFLLIDGNRYTGEGIPYRTIVGGDAKCLSIAAASILAKVARDRWMSDVAGERYPQYGFAKHKGYGTKAHVEKILKYGPCEIHRKTFLKKLYARQDCMFSE